MVSSTTAQLRRLDSFRLAIRVANLEYLNKELMKEILHLQQRNEELITRRSRLMEILRQAATRTQRSQDNVLSWLESKLKELQDNNDCS